MYRIFWRGEGQINGPTSYVSLLSVLCIWSDNVYVCIKFYNFWVCYSLKIFSINRIMKLILSLLSYKIFVTKKQLCLFAAFCNLY